MVVVPPSSTRLTQSPLSVRATTDAPWGKGGQVSRFLLLYQLQVVFIYIYIEQQELFYYISYVLLINKLSSD